MEIRARYVLVGAFALAAILAGFGFVYWLENVGGLGERASYRIRFETTVSGLLLGSPVQFNGIRVGEVTRLGLNPQAPKEVVAVISIAAETPVRADTRVDLDFSGLTGVPEIALIGGEASAPRPSAPNGALPELIAHTTGSDWTQAARDAFVRVDAILAENSDALKDALNNLDTFAKALARNSDRLDTVMAGLERFSGNVSKGPAVAYDLTAPDDIARPLSMPAGQLVVNEPSAVVTLNSQGILVQSGSGMTPGFAGSQWADSLPKLVQARLIESFEKAGYGKVGTDMQGLVADRTLALDISRFLISTDPERRAEVAMMSKLIAPDGAIVAARSFAARVDAPGDDAATAAAALDKAFGNVARELVPWVTESL